MKPWRLCLFGFIIFGIQYASAYTERSLYVGGGFFQYNLNRVTKNLDGDRQTWGTQHIPLVVKYYRSFQGEWYWSPQFTLTHVTSLVYPVEVPEKRVTKDLLVLNSFFSKKFNSDFDFFTGPGLFIYQIQGKGGTVELNNGTSTSEFPLPSRLSLSRSIVWSVGVGYSKDLWNLSAETLFHQLFSEPRRSYSFFLSFSYQVGQ